MEENMNLNNIHELSRLLLICVPPVALLFFAFPVWYFTQKVVSYEMRTAVRLAAFCMAVMPMLMLGVAEPDGYWIPAIVLLALSIFNPVYLGMFLMQLIIPWSLLFAIFVGRHWWINRTTAVPKRLVIKGTAIVLAMFLLVGGVVYGPLTVLSILLSGSGLGMYGVYIALPFGLLAAAFTFLFVASKWRVQP